MKHKREKKLHLAMTLLFSFVTFCILFVTVILASMLIWIFLQTGLFSGGNLSGGTRIVLYMAFFSLAIGTILTFFIGRVSLQPLHQLISKMDQLASGDFQARLLYKKPLCDHPPFRALSESFNKMAEELQNTELLRNDFVNNFSHEFKTPIVSIAGFAKLLRRADLSEEQSAEYLSIIEEESLRLSYMATNVLNLTKVENQTILSDLTEYNLSEQIRSCVLLLEDKWTRKNLNLDLDFGECMISASEELLKQVWINLLSNAVKFTPPDGDIVIRIRETDASLTVCIANSGSEIPKEKQEKIFHKFYQADESHSSMGNGIGLAIVRRVTELHHGTVSVESGNGQTAFTVALPKHQ